MNAQSVKGRPRILVVHPESNPLRHNLFLSLKNRTARVLGKARVHSERVRVNIGKENGIVRFRFDVHAGVAEVGVPAFVRDFAVHDLRREGSCEILLPLYNEWHCSTQQETYHRGHAVTMFERHACAISIAVRSVSNANFECECSASSS